MTDRHNRLVRCVRKAIEKDVANDLIGEIHENTSIQIAGLSPESSRLRPDMWFIRRYNNKRILEILEFSCPFGYIEDGESSLKRTFDYKLNKYQHLANEITNVTALLNIGNLTVRVHPIIVSSLGALYHDSMKCLSSILNQTKTQKKDLRKLGSWMSDQAIMGSFKLWIRHQRTANHHTPHSEEIQTEISLANQENIDDLSNDNEPQNEEEEDNTINERVESDEGRRDTEDDTEITTLITPTRVNMPNITAIVQPEPEIETHTTSEQGTRSTLETMTHTDSPFYR
jgi:hypothetical protein